MDLSGDARNGLCSIHNLASTVCSLFFLPGRLRRLKERFSVVAMSWKGNSEATKRVLFDKHLIDKRGAMHGGSATVVEAV